MDGPQPIFEYLDYRQYLADFYKFKKKNFPYFTYRYISLKTGVDASYLARVLQGKRHLTPKRINAFCKLLDLKDLEKLYFETLVAFNRSKSDHEAKRHFDRLLQLTSVPVKKMEKDQLEYYRHWYYSAIRGLIGAHQFLATGDFERIASCLSPKILSREAKNAVELLQRLKMIEVGANQVLKQTEKHVTTGNQWSSAIIRHFQKQSMRLGMESIERHNKDIRDISTLTFGVPFKDMPKFRETIAEFRNAMVRLVEQCDDPDDIYQLNIQLFPLTQTGKRSK